MIAAKGGASEPPNMRLPGKAGGTVAVRRTLASTICRIADPTQVPRPRQLRDASTGDCQEFRARLGGLTDQSMAAVKRSPKRTANCDLAMDHSRGGMIHSFSDRFKTRKRSLVAASSVGNGPWP